MSRRTARELSMKLLYQLDIQIEHRDNQIGLFLELNPLSEKDKEYFISIINGVYNKLNYIDDIVSKISKGWKLERISKVDLAILRLAVYEIAFREDIPYNVSINEAVELAKNYSSKESSSFINGILGKVVEKIKNDA